MTPKAPLTGLVGPLRQGPRGQLGHATGHALFREHVRTALLTRARWDAGDTQTAGERLMREEFGCRVHALLHEPLTEETAALTESLLTEDLQRSLPHLPLTNIHTQLNEEQGALHVSLQFALPNGEMLPYDTDVFVARSGGSQSAGQET